MVLANNDIELMDAIGRDMKLVIDEVASKILEMLIDSINQVVYDAGVPHLYRRLEMNGGLSGEWRKSNAEIIGNEIISTIDSDPTTLVVDPENFVHGSNHWEMDDISGLLNEIIIEGKSGPYFGEGFWREPRDFWSPIIAMLEDGTVDSMIAESMIKNGINLV